MKHLLLVACIVFLLLPTIGAAQIPSITIEDVSPQPVEPGKNVTIVTKFVSKEQAIMDFTLDLVMPDSFTLISKDGVLGETSICGFCTQQKTYIVAIGSSTISGTYILQLKGSSGTFSVTAPITVQVTGNPNLLVATDQDNLGKLVAGSPFSLDVVITNIGTAVASEVTVAPSSTNFIPLGGATKSVGIIAPGKSKTVTFNLLVGESVSPNAYSLPMNISYVDDEGNAVSVLSSIGVLVINAGQLSLQSMKIATQLGSPSISAADSFTMIARIENVGHGTADFITTEIHCSFDGGSKKSYLGSLDEGEDAPAVFDFLPAQAGDHSCDLTVSYADDLGEHSFTESIMFTISPVDYTGVFVLIVIILVIAYYLYQRRQKGKK
ncbi:MAG: hypothetical protein KKA90_02885 [Nanoarchaeota archaeon]|nr:hypothetical protein [Nanoarchaeota archaeon]